MVRNPSGSREAIIWWEKRRPLFNLVLLVVGVATIIIIELVGSWVLPPGEDAMEPIALVIGIVGYGIAANACYTLGWITEIQWNGGDSSQTRALRPKVFRLGLIFSLILTLSPAVIVPLLWLVFDERAAVQDSADDAINPTACKKMDASFKEFLSRFTDNKAFQRSRLVLPLVARFGNYLTVDAAVELWPLAKIEQMQDSLIFSTAERKKLNLSQEIVMFQSNRYAEVYQANAGEADDTRVLFHFRNLKGCWFLEEIDDRSL